VGRVLISGAGIAGPSLAFWLRRLGAQPTLVERAPGFRDSGYMIDVWGLGYDLIERMGLLDAALDLGYRMQRVIFVDEGGQPVSGFDANVFERAVNGRFFSIPRGDLARVIFDSVAGEIETLYSTEVTSLHEDPSGVEVELAGRPAQRFDLVVGADGLRSGVRGLAFGPQERFEKYLGYCAAAFVAENYPHRDAATYVSYAQPGRQISRYALRGNRTAFLLVFARQTIPASHDLASRKRLLREEFRNDGWEVPEILARLDDTDDLYFDAVSQIRVQRWTCGRIALVGDAAYCPSLLAGAGAAFAMLGAYVIAGELQRSPRDPVTAFARYERRLRPFLDAEQLRAARFASSFAPRTALGLRIRNAVLDLMRFKPLGVWYARRMFAPALELPQYGPPLRAS
jgi:2-polyprenyl-6-methoxyphenol hydroxylase-like FAD-dependent oxidoreductase